VIEEYYDEMDFLDPVREKEVLKQIQKREDYKKSKAIFSKAYKDLVESNEYKTVKRELLKGYLGNPVKVSPSQEGMYKAFGDAKFKEGLFHFFVYVESLAGSR